MTKYQFKLLKQNKNTKNIKMKSSFNLSINTSTNTNNNNNNTNNINNNFPNQNNLIKISNIFNSDNKNFYLPKTNKNLLEFNLKGLNLYNISLNSYISKYNFKDLILNLKKNSISNLDLIENKNINNKLIGIENKPYKNVAMPNNNKNKTYKLNLNKYLGLICINNKIYNNKNNIFNYAKYIEYENISVNNLFLLKKNLYKLLFNSFFSMNSLMSKPIFEVTNDKVVIHLFMYLFINKNKKVNTNNSFIKLNNLKLNILCQILSNFFKKPVELDLVRLYYPYFDSNIFVNLLSKLINKIKLRIIMKHFFKKAIIRNPIKFYNNNLIIKIPSLLSGIKLRIGGRLMTQRLIPKKTVKTIRKGTLAKGKINFLDEARYTNKNKRGAFTLIISIGHYLT
jgi:hypothetical protein